MPANNPPAFPLMTITGESTYTDNSNDGMTLRDYFAAAALIGWLADGTNSDTEVIARRVYGFADAMLKAREEQNGKI